MCIANLGCFYKLVVNYWVKMKKSHIIASPYLMS
jgi:hypothetical protein